MSVLIEHYPGNLFQSNIFKPYEAKQFNENKHISNSMKLSLDDHAKKCCGLLKKYDLNDLLGINRTHNHFYLKKNEIVEASFVENKAECPYESSTDFVIRLRAKHLTDEELNVSEKKPLPYMWAYDRETKKLYGTQFFMPPNKVILKNLNKLSDNIDNLKLFYRDFVEYLEANGLHDDLGLVLVHDNNFKIDYAKHNFIEKTDEETRLTIHTPIESPCRDDKRLKHVEYEGNTGLKRSV
jgi:hypothetical protein